MPAEEEKLAVDSLGEQCPTEQIGVFVTIHATLPADILNWTLAMARTEGHSDVLRVVMRALGFPKEPASARLRQR